MRRDIDAVQRRLGEKMGGVVGRPGFRGSAAAYLLAIKRRPKEIMKAVAG